MQTQPANAVYKYLVSIDCIFDTRLGTIALLDPEYAAKVIADPEYYTRTTETFKTGSKKFKAADFDTYYAMRDITTLKNSIVTKLIDYIADDISEQLKEPSTRFTEIRRELYLNVWPYVFDKDMSSTLVESLHLLLPYFDDIKVCSYSLLELEPSFIKQQEFNFVYQYDFQGWMNANMSKLEHCRIPRHYLIFPDLMNRPIPNTASTELKELAKVISPTKALEIFAMEHMLMSLRFEPVKYFCINKDLIKTA
jgi:hypothetical protein